MNNDDKFLVVEVKENGSQLVLASKLKFSTINLSEPSPTARKGKWIRLVEGTPQLVSFDGGAKMVNGNLSVWTVIVGAYDDEDEECKDLLKTEYFLKVARGSKLPVGNKNQLKGQRVTMEFNSHLQCWEVVRVGHKYDPRPARGLVYAFHDERQVRIHAPGWPVDFQLDCENQNRSNLLGKWFDFSIPGDFKTLKWRDVRPVEPEQETLRDGDIVMIRLPCWLDRNRRSLRTEQNDLVMDMGGSLTRFFEETEEGAIQLATLELCPLNNGTMRLAPHQKKPTIVGEKSASGVVQTPSFDGKASSGGRVKGRSELSKKDAEPIDAKDEIELLSKKIQEQQQIASMLFLTVTKCPKISNQTAQELDKSYIHLTSYECQLFCDFHSVDDARKTIATLKKAIKKYEEFFKKANLAVLRSGRINIPKAANAFLANLRK
ncbi:unnamed protein product [Caenorhabditis brenneri]